MRMVPLLFLIVHFVPLASESTFLTFTKPEGWQLADPASLPPHVHGMAVGKGKSPFPPSINLATEPFQGTLDDYLRIVQEINRKQGVSWRSLGSIDTRLGPASLSQIDQKSEWGAIRMMHAIVVKDEMVIILTAAALADEFPTFYQPFFNAMRSLRLEAHSF